MELDQTWIWITISGSGYEKYLTMLLSYTIIWFFTPHNILRGEAELDFIWTIPLDIFNLTKE